MSKKAGTALSVMAMVFMGALASPLTVLAADAEETYQPALYATIWALLPPLVAIVLALITKEVYSSLFVGIVVGALIYSGFKFEGTVTQIFEGGIIKVLSDSYNVGILIFLVILGSVVCMMNKAGGSAAFGRWASKKIHTRVGAELAAIILGILIFIDDYFNCLTVGSVMRPVTDRHHVSRAKFAYLIDATAAPVCIIAPISSWAAAVSGFVEGQDGLAIFVRTIPYNFYAILTIVMMVGMVLMKTEFGAMRTHEINALNGDLYTTSARPYENATDDAIMQALEVAQAKEFVDKKEGGLDFEIEQGGKNLSGGQRQRMTIARAVVKKPDILILDDSASALDFATDAKLRMAIRDMENKATVFIVSQRAASIMYADKIIVLDDGQIVGMGTHEELLKQCEVYQEIYYSQFKKTEDEKEGR